VKAGVPTRGSHRGVTGGSNFRGGEATTGGPVMESGAYREKGRTNRIVN